jgi:hypothetical protein
VKQFVLDRFALAAIRDDVALLDQQAAGEEIAITVENAAAVRALLDREGLRYRVVDLNLDEIFSAYVAGVFDDRASSAEAALEAAPQA